MPYQLTGHCEPEEYRRECGSQAGVNGATSAASKGWTLRFVHASLASAMLMFLSITSIWCLGLVVLRRPFSSSLVGTLILAQGLILAQVLSGILLLIGGERAGQWEHFLYGITAAVFFPVTYLYARRHPDWGRLLLFALASLWIVALSVRGMTTGM